MIRGFEKLTHELTDEEKQILPTIIKGLINRKGKQNAVSSLTIQWELGITRPRIRKIIGHIRTNDLIFGLCSTRTGYYVAENIQELEECMISLQQRISSQIEILNALEKQSVMFGGTGEQTDFE